MKYYDVIIIGAGVAGCGLAYNLKRIGYTGSVLIVEKNKIGSSKCHNVRTAFRKTVDEYKLPSSCFHSYKGLKIGAYDKVYVTINKEILGINYQKFCEHLLKKSEMEITYEKVINTQNQIIKTDKSVYKSRYIIDCSGNDAIVRRKFNLALPFRFWIGHLKTIENNTNFNTDYLYHLFADEGFVEEINPTKKIVSCGHWQFTKKIDFNLIKPHDKLLGEKFFPEAKVFSESYGAVPISKVLPLVYKKYAFVGDSFGAPTASMGYGVEVTLDSSKLLAKAIYRNSLKSYEQEWKRKYLEREIQYLTSKIDRYHNSEFLSKIKDYPSLSKIYEEMGDDPDFYYNLLTNPTQKLKFPERIKKLFPKRQLLFQSFHYMTLKMKYLNMSIN